jgi:uncharacterized protein (DUF697 family)
MIDYFLHKLKEQMSNNREKAEKVIQSSVVWSMGAGLIPIPVADMMAVTAIQVDMLKQVSSIYNQDFSDASFKNWIGTLTGSALSGAIKFIPGIGSLIGGVSMAALAGASTYAVGQVFLEHFEAGGSLKDFEVEKFKDFYEKQFEKGKNLVKEWQKDLRQSGDSAKEEAAAPNQPPKAPSTSAPVADAKPEVDVVAKLRELSDLLDRGIITQEEFKRLKDRILQSL